MPSAVSWGSVPGGRAGGGSYTGAGPEGGAANGSEPRNVPIGAESRSCSGAIVCGTGKTGVGITLDAGFVAAESVLLELSAIVSTAEVPVGAAAEHAKNRADENPTKAIDKDFTTIS